MSEPVYKICDEAAYLEAKAKGRFEGSPDDFRDGFIHLSAGRQVASTLAAHFAGREGLVLLTVDFDRLGEGLRWERSRGGDLFPHLYGLLHFEHVTSAEMLKVGEDGSHILPAGLRP